MRRRQGLAILVLVLLVTNLSVAALADPDAVARAHRQAASGRYLVQLKVEASSEESLPHHPDAVIRQRQAMRLAKDEVRAALAGRVHRVAREYESVPFMAVEGGADVLAVLAPMASRIYRDHLFAPSLPESVPLIRANQAWVQGFDGSGSVVAILDTGVDSSHPFFAGKIISEACYSGNNNCQNGLDTQVGAGAAVPCTFAATACRHGTHVAGIAAGSGATFSGVARGAGIMAIRVFSKFTGSACAGGVDPCALAYTSDLIAAMEHVYELRGQYQIAAVNMSVGGRVYHSTDECDADNGPIKAIVATLRSVGIATVVAAGNSGAPNGLSAPACVSSAISVGSTTKGDAVNSFSNSASFLSLLAPGSSILSAIPGGGFASFSGTSMATPHVTGAWAVLKQKNPQASVAAVLDALVSTGVTLTDPKNGIAKPRIDVAGAVAMLSVQASPSPGLTINGSSAPITAVVGTPISVVATNLAPNDSNIVALFAAGAANSQSLNWVFLTGNQTTRSGSLTGVTTSFVLPGSGTFEVRALHWVAGVGYVTDATSPTVTAQGAGGGTVTVNGSSTPITVPAGSPITVVAANLAANDSNIVALFGTGAANSQSLSWVFLTGNQTTRSGSLTGVTTSFVLPGSGTFEVRALHWVSGIGYVTDATSPTVTAQSAGGGTLTVNGSSTPITVSAGSPITVVAANLAPHDSNIVALFATGTANSQSLSWVFLTGNQTGRSGSLTGVTTSFVLPGSGTFEVRALHWVSGTGYVTDVISSTVTVQ